MICLPNPLTFRKRFGTFRNMKFGKSQICVTRGKPRYPVEAQRSALELAGCGDWVSLDDTNGLRSLLDRLRKNDVVKVRHLHLLAPAKRRTDENPRRALWSILHQIEDRGATVLEISTGRSTANQRDRDMMIADAIEVVTRGARAVARARENGKKGGRPPAVIKDENREHARRYWFERQELQGLRLRQCLGRVGYSLARCYREFGPRQGRE